MPVLHRRSNGDGYYVNGRLDGRFVTLQLVRPAKRLLTNRMGYEDEDRIPWKLMTPLCMLGHAYSQTGGGPGGDATGKEFSAAIDKLSSSQERYLRNYLSSYDNYTPAERNWVNKHVFNGSRAVSTDQISEFPECKGGSNEKVEELSSIWDKVTEDHNQDNPASSDLEESSNSNKSNRAPQRNSRSNSKSERGPGVYINPSRFESDSIEHIPIGRISNNGNAIVEIFGGGHLNLAKIPDIESGDRARVKILSTPEEGSFEVEHVPETNSTESNSTESNSTESIGVLDSIVSKLKTVF